MSKYLNGKEKKPGKRSKKMLLPFPTHRIRHGGIIPKD
jgi:hypothetical protein